MLENLNTMTSFIKSVTENVFKKSQDDIQAENSQLT